MRYHACFCVMGLRRAFLSRGSALAFLALILTCFLGSRLHAQVLYGSLTGNVTDASNAPVPQAKIEVANVGTGIATEGVTDTRGIYLISDLQPGVYRVTISAPGFATIVQENVRVDANTTRRTDVQMEVARVNQNITVNAPAEALQTDRTDVKSELSSTQVTSLPLGSNRNFQTLYILLPGSTPPAVAHSAAGNPTQSLAMYINGGAETANMTLIDGTIDTNFWEQDLIGYVPPAEAIESVNIVTSGFDAEQGQATGSVTSVAIKSGTNSFHGSAFEYNTISALQARNFFYYGPSIPKSVVNQFGISLGGPIKKNKLFFFADWERYRQSSLSTDLTSVPTQAIRQGDFSSVSTKIYDPTTGNSDGSVRSQMGSATGALNVIPSTMISSAAAKMAALIPLPNYGAAGAIAINYQALSDILFNRDSVDLKINYIPSDKSTFFARYSAEPTWIFDPQILGPAGGAAAGGGQPGTAPGLIQCAALGGTYTFTPHLLLDANVGYMRPRIAAENTDIGTNFGLTTLSIPGTNGPNPLQGGIPYFAISSLASLGNPNNANPFLFRDNEYTVAANLSWIKGSHSFRFGSTLGRYDLNQFQGDIDWGVRGGFGFTGGLTALKGGSAPNAYNSWADFLLGLPQSMGKDYVYTNPLTMRESEWALYARDNWQVTKKLSIDYGVRYEAYPVPSRDHYGASNYDPTTNLAYLGGEGGVPNNAYISAGHGQLVPRVGIAYRLNEKTVVRTGFGISSDSYPFRLMVQFFYPTIVSQQIPGANTYSAAGSLATGIPAFTFPDLSQGKFLVPTNVGVEAYPKNLARGYTESWNFTVQRDLGKDFNLQVAYVGTHSVNTQARWNYNSVGPGGGSAGTPLYKAWGNANGLYYDGPYGGGSYNALQTQLMRRVAGSQLGVVYTYSKAIDIVDTETGSLSWSWGPMVSRNRALAGYDRPHNLEFFAVYNSPFGHSQHWVTKGVGAAILGDWSFSPVLSRMSGTPFSVSSSSASLNAPGNAQTADQVEPHVAILGGHGPNSPYFDPMAFAAVTTVRFGTSGRDIVRGPGYFNINASLVRDFNLTERFKLQFRTEAYGLTNTPSFGNPGATVSNATFVNGQVSNYNGYDIISSASGQRQIRFALKLSF